MQQLVKRSLAGGRVEANPRGREFGFGRRITLTAEGRTHEFNVGGLGGGGGGVPRMFFSTYAPRCTGDVRFGYEVTVSRLAWPSRPPRGVPASSTRRKRVP